MVQVSVAGTRADDGDETIEQQALQRSQDGGKPVFNAIFDLS